MMADLSTLTSPLFSFPSCEKETRRRLSFWTPNKVAAAEEAELLKKYRAVCPEPDTENLRSGIGQAFRFSDHFFERGASSLGERVSGLPPFLGRSWGQASGIEGRGGEGLTLASWGSPSLPRIRKRMMIFVVVVVVVGREEEDKQQNPAKEEICERPTSKEKEEEETFRASPAR